MPTSPHREVATALRNQLYILTEKLLESSPSYGKYCAMHDGLVKRTIPLSWPKASPRSLDRIAAGLPAVSYLADKKQQTADAKMIEGVLLEAFPIRSQGKKKPIPAVKRSPKKPLAKQSAKKTKTGH